MFCVVAYIVFIKLSPPTFALSVARLRLTADAVAWIPPRMWRSNCKSKRLLSQSKSLRLVAAQHKAWVDSWSLQGYVSDTTKHPQRHHLPTSCMYKSSARGHRDHTKANKREAHERLRHQSGRRAQGPQGPQGLRQAHGKCMASIHTRASGWHRVQRDHRDRSARLA